MRRPLGYHWVGGASRIVLPWPVCVGLRRCAVPIEHVVVLCLANRSFDHMLGFLDHPDPSFDGLLRGGPYDNAGADGRSRVRATPEAKKVLPYGPDYSHDAVMEQLTVKGSGADRRAT